MRNIQEEIYKILDIRIVRHILFWLSYVLVMSYIHAYGINSEGYLSWLMNYLIELPVIIGLSYMICYFLLPQLLSRKFYILFGISVILTLIVFSGINIILDIVLIAPYFLISRVDDISFSFMAILANAFGLLLPVVVFISITFAKNMAEAEKREMLKKQDFVRKKLDDIRNQLHPVFIRDAMNDLLILSADKPEELPDTILKISNIFQYLIYDCNNDRVYLRQEEAAIRNYLSFENVIYSPFDFQIKLRGEIENIRVAPYILFPLARAVSIFQKGDCGLKDLMRVSISVENSKLFYDLEKEIHGEIKNLDFNWKEEINLAQQKLEFSYPWKYKMDVVETERKLQVKVIVELKP